MPAGYRHLPPYYDRWQRSYGKDFSTQIFPRLLSSIRTHRIGGRSMADIACGTGTLALLMARRGWEVTGVDASEGMLAVAGEKFAGSSLPVLFLCQDMRALSLPHPVHLATSFFDSLNHITSPEELEGTFARIRKSLLPGGWLVFDTSTERCFTALWTRSETVTERGFSIILDNSYDRDARDAVCHVTLVVARGRESEHLSETVREKYYTPEEVAGMLARTGFAVREREDFSFTTNPAAGKLKTWWVAQAG